MIEPDKWTRENAQNVYFRLNREGYGPDYPTGHWLVTGLGDGLCVEATHVESGAVRRIALLHLGSDWKPVAVKALSNPCAECGGVAPKDDYLCEDCRA